MWQRGQGKFGRGIVPSCPLAMGLTSLVGLWCCQHLPDMQTFSQVKLFPAWRLSHQLHHQSGLPPSEVKMVSTSDRVFFIEVHSENYLVQSQTSQKFKKKCVISKCVFDVSFVGWFSPELRRACNFLFYFGAYFYCSILLFNAGICLVSSYAERQSIKNPNIRTKNTMLNWIGTQNSLPQIQRIWADAVLLKGNGNNTRKVKPNV